MENAINPFEEAIKYLWNGKDEFDDLIYSCDALRFAISANKSSTDSYLSAGLLIDKIEPNLWATTKAFEEFLYGKKRQQARILWLTWCALMWEEEFFK